jgi:hypothetical protein
MTDKVVRPLMLEGVSTLEGLFEAVIADFSEKLAPVYAALKECADILDAERQKKEKT